MNWWGYNVSLKECVGISLAWLVCVLCMFLALTDRTVGKAPAPIERPSLTSHTWLIVVDGHSRYMTKFYKDGRYEADHRKRWGGGEGKKAVWDGTWKISGGSILVHERLVSAPMCEKATPYRIVFVKHHKRFDGNYYEGCWVPEYNHECRIALTMTRIHHRPKKKEE